MPTRRASKKVATIPKGPATAPRVGQTAYDYIAANNRRYVAEAHEFQRVFRRKLRPLWSSITGLDVIKFDEVLGVPDDRSTQDFVQEHYGDEGVALVKRLIGL